MAFGFPIPDRGVRATIQTAEQELRRLEEELRNTRGHLEEKRDAAERCRRRESLARAIGDAETAELGARFGARHAEKAALLERKADVLSAELEMREREMDEMRAALAAQRRAAPDSDRRARHQRLQRRGEKPPRRRRVSRLAAATARARGGRLR